MNKLSKAVRIGGFAAMGCLIAGLVGAFAEPPAGPRTKAAALPPSADKNVVAYINGEAITRQELAEELLARKGKEQLELLINRRLIEQACQQAGIQITDGEVEEELKDTLKTLGIADPAMFEEQVLKERHSSLFEYKNDVLRPTIAMRKLAGNRIQVTEEDIRKAYESAYGEKVRCRVIMIQDQKEAYRIHAAVREDRDAFLREASRQQQPNLAANGGLTRINRHSFFDGVEKEAFRLRDGEVSQILAIPKQGHVILLREGLEPADKSISLRDAWETLGKQVQEQKLRKELPKVFKEIKEQAVVRDYLNGKYDLKEMLPDPAGRQASGLNQPRKKTSQ